MAALSAIALAADTIADGLDAHLKTAIGGKITVSVDTPQGASKAVSEVLDTYFVNLFFYRVSHSGFHASLGADDPLFVRLHCLVTPFPGKFDPNADPHLELALLGEAIRFFHDRQLFKTLITNPAFADGTAATSYKLECTMLQPSMEEINHIWTTQGENLPYRLSAAYEFSLIPIEPLKPAPPASLVRTAEIDLNPSVKPPLPPGSFGPNLRAIPLTTRTAAPPPPAPKPPSSWLPLIMLRDGGKLTNAKTVPPATTEVDLALSGRPGERAAIETLFFQADNKTQTGATVVDFVDIAAALLDDDDATRTHTFARPLDAASMAVRARLATTGAGGDQIIDDAPFTHTLTVTFGP